MSEEAGTAEGHDRLPPFRLVEVEWVDAFNLAAGWRDIEAIREDADDHIRNWSAGYLIAETSEAIAVTVAVNFDHEQAAGGVTVIPRTAIRSIRDLHRGSITTADLLAGPSHNNRSPSWLSAADDDTGGAAAAGVTPGRRSAPRFRRASPGEDATRDRDSGPRTGAADAREGAQPHAAQTLLTGPEAARHHSGAAEAARS